MRCIFETPAAQLVFNTHSASVRRPFYRFSVLYGSCNSTLSSAATQLTVFRGCTAPHGRLNERHGAEGGAKKNPAAHYNEGLAAGCPPRACLIETQRPEAYKATPLTSYSANAASSPSRQTDKIAYQRRCLPSGTSALALRRR